MATSSSFSAVGNGAQALVPSGSTISYTISGTFVGTLQLVYSTTGGNQWTTITQKTAAATGTYILETKDGSPALVMWRCTAYTSGTAVTEFSSDYMGDDGDLDVHAASHAAMGLVSIPSLTPNDTSAATANTAAINAALATGNKVLINGLGTALTEAVIWYNDNLITQENPEIEVARFTRLKLMPNINVNGANGVSGFISQKYVDVHLSGLSHSVNSLTYSAGIITATVPNANTYIPAVGDMVSVWNAGWGFFNNVARVLSVTVGGSTTTFTYKSTGPCSIATAPGIREGIRYCKAVKGTVFKGQGTIDGNYQNGNDGAPATAGKCGIIHCHDYGTRVEGSLNFENLRQRCVFEWQTLDSYMGDYSVTRCAVGWQSNGTVINPVFERVRGQEFQDDLLALMDREAPGYPEVNLCEGDIINAVVRDLRADNDGEATLPGNIGVALHCYSMSKLYRNSVTVDRASGQASGTNAYQVQVEGRGGLTFAPSAVGDIVELVCLGTIGGVLAFDLSKMPRPLSCPAYTENTQSGASYSLQTSDKNKLVIMTNASGTVVIPTTGWSAGDRVAIKQSGAALTINANSQTVYGLTTNIEGQFDKIEVNNYSLASDLGFQFRHGFVGEIKFNKLTPNTKVGTVVNQWLSIEGTCQYGSFLIDGMDCTHLRTSGVGAYLIHDYALNYIANNEYSAGTVEIKNIRHNAAGDFIYQCVPASSDRRRSIKFENFYGKRNAGAKIGKINSNVRVYQLSFVNVYPHSGDAQFINQGRADNVLVQGGAMYGGCLIEFAGGGSYTTKLVVNGYDISDNDGGKPLVRINNASNNTVIDATVNGLALGTGVLVTQMGGSTNTFNPKNFGCELDVTQGFVGKAVGNCATHNKSGGTNTGPAIANGTSYYQQAQGAAVPAVCG